MLLIRDVEGITPEGGETDLVPDKDSEVGMDPVVVGNDGDAATEVGFCEERSWLTLVGEGEVGTLLSGAEKKKVLVETMLSMEEFWLEEASPLLDVDCCTLVVTLDGI